MKDEIKAIYVSMLKADWVLVGKDYMTYDKVLDEHGNIVSYELRHELKKIYQLKVNETSLDKIDNCNWSGLPFAKNILKILIKPNGY